MATHLEQIRSSQIQPRWKYLEESVRLELEQTSSRARMTSVVNLEDWRKIDALLAKLDPSDRDAFIAVVRYEIDTLLFWCRMQAELFPLQRAAGVL